MAHRQAFELVGDIDRNQVSLAYVDGDGHAGQSLGQALGEPRKDEVPDMAIECHGKTVALEQRHKRAGRDEVAVSVFPAGKGLAAYDLFGLHVVLRLNIERDMPLAQGALKRRKQIILAFTLRIRFGFKVLDTVFKIVAGSGECGFCMVV